MAALVPVFFGLASGRILSLSLPSLLAPDATAVTNASRLAILPLELLASGSAIAIFPTLSALAARGELGEVRSQLFALLRRVSARLCVASLLLIILAFPLVRALFEHGKFSATDATLTAQILMMIALSLPALGAQQLLARGFFALGDNTTPVKAGLGAMALFGLLTLISSALGWGTLGVTGASVVAVSVLAAILWKGLAKKLGQL
jgi:putative peptidoglycan lipid II flippase